MSIAPGEFREQIIASREVYKSFMRRDGKSDNKAILADLPIKLSLNF